MTPDLVLGFELGLAPLLFVLLVRHAGKALGSGRAAFEALALVAYTFALALAASPLLGAAVFSEAWRVAPLGVPLALPLFWTAAALSALALAARLTLRTPLARAAAATLLCLTLDGLLQVAAVAEGLWRFDPSGRWRGVPLAEPLALAVALAPYLWCAERVSPQSTRARQVGFRALAALVGLGLSAGTLWLGRANGPDVEDRLPPAAGWVVWGGVWVATLAVCARRRWSALGTSLGSRLGVVGGHGPGLVFVVAAVALATKAVVLGPPALRLAALLPALLLVGIAGSDVHQAALSSWRQRMHGRLAGAESLVAVLMKRPNGQPWTRDERAFLHGELRAMARFLPALVLFLLPGSVILLPLYAWLLDRRRGNRKGEAARSLVGPSSGPPRPEPRRTGVPGRRPV